MPFWDRKPQQRLLYEAYLATGHIPERLKVGLNRDKPEVDDEVRIIAEQYGASFISVTDILCNADGCLARLGDTGADIVQFDSTHLSSKGSLYVVKAIEGPVFDSLPSPLSVGSVR
jgi:hypothetical protein